MARGGGARFFCWLQGGEGQSIFLVQSGGGEPFFLPAGRRFYKRRPRNKCNLPSRIILIFTTDIAIGRQDFLINIMLNSETLSVSVKFKLISLR